MIEVFDFVFNPNTPMTVQIEEKINELSASINGLHYISIHGGLSTFKQIRNEFAYYGKTVPPNKINFELVYFTHENAYEVVFHYEKHAPEGMVKIKCLS